MTTSANDRHRLHQWALRLLARETKRARPAMCTSSTMHVPVAPCAQMHYLVAVLPQLKDAVCKAVCKAPVSLQSAHLWQNSYCCPRVRLLAATNATICPRVALWHSLAAPLSRRDMLCLEFVVVIMGWQLIRVEIVCWTLG